jgi:hypothetical protein
MQFREPMHPKRTDVRCLPLDMRRLLSIPILLVFLGVVSPTPGFTGDEAKTVRPHGPAEKECACRTGEKDSADALKRLLSAAVRARGGLAKLQSRKDDYSVTRIAYRDVYATEVLQRTWTMKPDSFRQDTVRDGVILKSQQYDGSTFLEGYGQRVRFGLEKDLKVFLENVELNKIFSLLCIGTEPYPASLGQRVRQEGGWLQEVIVEAPSGLTYRLFLEEDTCLITRMEYVERAQYAESEEVLSIVTHVDSYRNVEGVLVADRLRLLSRGTLKAEVRLIEYELNVGLSAGFFSMDRLRQDLAENPVKSGEVPPTGKVEEEWRGSAYRKIVERLQTHGNCRFREVASYGDPKRYHERLFGSGLVLVVDPKYLEADDVLAFYAELLPAPTGFYEDCIVLAAPPESASVSGDLLLHETTHAILRRGQEEAPLAIVDDEYLAYYQGSLFGVGNLLELFERIVFDGKRTTEPQISEKAARIWRTFRRNLQQFRRQNRMTQEALEQFREWCGVDFDLYRIRRHYLDLGVDPKWMPMDSAAGN